MNQSKSLHRNMPDTFGSQTAAHAQLEADQADTMNHYNWYPAFQTARWSGVL